MRSTMAILVAVALRLASPGLAVEPPFRDGFEDFTVGAYPAGSGWEMMFSGSGSDGAVVSDTVAHSGNKSFRLRSLHSWSRQDYVRLEEIPDRVTYGASMYIGAFDTKRGVVGFMKKTGVYGPQWDAFFVQTAGGSGYVSFGTRPDRVFYIGAYTPGTWCTVRADLDYVKLEGDLWLDGELVVEGVPIKPKQWIHPTFGQMVPDKLGLGSANDHAGDVYFDDIWMSGPFTGCGPGDTDVDGDVDDDDLSLLLANWTGVVGEGKVWGTGDFDGNGAVSDVDLSLLLANWTGCGAVPEPTTVGVLTIGAVGLLLRRRRRPE